MPRVRRRERTVVTAGQVPRIATAPAMSRHNSNSFEKIAPAGQRGTMAGRSERRLKIAFVFMPANTVRPPVWSTSYGTAGDLVMDELARRVARSHNVIAYCLRGAGQEPVEHCEGVEYRRVTAPLDRRFQSYQRKMMRLAGFVRQQNTPWTVLNSEWWHRQYIGKVVGDPALRDCDIIHIMNISQFVRIARSRVPRTRVVLHMHCQWLEQLDAKAIERRIKAADLILGVSDFIAAGVRRRFPELAQRCSHIYNGADPDLFRRLGGVQAIPKQILYVGQLAPEKGIHVLLDAFRTVLAQHPDAHLKLIGPHTVFPARHCSRTPTIVILHGSTNILNRVFMRKFCAERSRSFPSAVSLSLTKG